jgi:hypothetical protein
MSANSTSLNQLHLFMKTQMLYSEDQPGKLKAVVSDTTALKLCKGMVEHVKPE